MSSELVRAVSQNQAAACRLWDSKMLSIFVSRFLAQTNPKHILYVSLISVWIFVAISPQPHS